MAEQKITIEFGECITEFIEFHATKYGFDGSKDFIEFLILESIFDVIGRAGPSKAKH